MKLKVDQYFGQGSVAGRRMTRNFTVSTLLQLHWAGASWNMNLRDKLKVPSERKCTTAGKA